MGVDEIYSEFAYIYDTLIRDVKYNKWADYIEEIFRKNGLNPELILDLGCGTGNFTIEMAKRGYELIGVDISTDMLSCASEKSRKEGLDILYINQDMTEFELYGTVDTIVCLMDSINYITDKQALKRMFKLVNNYLNPEGIFIFDINSSYKFENILDGNVFYSVEDEITYIWENNYDRESGICEFDLTFFIGDGENYKRHDELHYERSYCVDELKEIIDASGMELKEVYGCLDFKPPVPESERIFFISRKKGG